MGDLDVRIQVCTQILISCSHSALPSFKRFVVDQPLYFDRDLGIRLLSMVLVLGARDP